MVSGLNMADENGWTAADPVIDKWPFRSGSAPVAATRKGRLIASCVLESPRLAAITSWNNRWRRHRFVATECSSQGSVSYSELNRSNPISSKWPDCYQRLGEPSKYTMSKPEGPSELHHSNTPRFGSFTDDVSVVSGASSARNWSRASSLVVQSVPAEFSLPAFSCKVCKVGKFGPRVHSIKNIPLPSGPSFGQVESSEEQVILQASQPAYLGGHPGCYLVRLVRASLKVSFGLELITAKTRDGQLAAIFVSDDLPFVGMSRWDRVLSINGWEPTSVEECGNIVERLLSIVLVLQSKGKQPVESVPRPVMELLPPADQRLLTIKKQMLTNESEFMLMIRRRSPKQSLGLSFDASLTPNEQGELVVTCDMLHLDVIAGDLLVSANGFRSPSKKVLCEILDTAIVIELTLRRHSSMSRPSPSEQFSKQKWETDEYLHAAGSLVDSLLACATRRVIDDHVFL